MKVDNIKETAVKEVLKPHTPDLSSKNSGSPYMKKKQPKNTFSAELDKKQLTPEQLRQLRNQTHKQVEKMTKDSVTISNRTPVSGADAVDANTVDAERSAVISASLDYSNKRRYDSYSKHTDFAPKKEKHMSISVFNIMFAICGLFLIVTGFIYVPVGIIWIVIGALMFMYAFVKK